MNRTALSVIALAVGSVLIIGLFNIYKPATKHLAHDVFNKVHIGNLSHPTTHHYAGMTYTDDGNGNIEFTKGILDNNSTSGGWVGGFATNGPKDIQKATSVKFDNGIDTTKVNSIAGMFSQDPNIKSVDLGDNFDTSNVEAGNHDGTPFSWGMDSMFEHDWNLEQVNLGSKFNTDHVDENNMVNMFDGDNKLIMPTGHVSNKVKDLYNTRYTGDPAKAPN